MWDDKPHTRPDIYCPLQATIIDMTSQNGVFVNQTIFYVQWLTAALHYQSSQLLLAPG